MLTLITGTPGSGKTLYAIAELLLPQMGKSITFQPEDSAPQTSPVKFFTNIRGLQIEHDLVDAGPSWERVKDEWTQKPGNRLGLHNWHEWAKPGSVIVPDEFQKIWPPRPNGAPVPPDVQAMDTHRHMGVDFVLITQKFSFDTHIRGLVGRHLHIRRIGNTSLCIVYEWDGCSHNLQFSKALRKSGWRFPKRVFKLYHSADAHTKQPRKVPTLVFVILLMLALAAWKIPESYSRIAGKGKEQQELMAQAGLLKPKGAAAAPVAPAPSIPASAPAAAAPAPIDTGPPRRGARKLPFAGCAQLGNLCRCFDDDGATVHVEPGVCEDNLPQGGKPVSVAHVAKEMARQAAAPHDPLGEYLRAPPEAPRPHGEAIRLTGTTVGNLR